MIEALIIAAAIACAAAYLAALAVRTSRKAGKHPACCGCCRKMLPNAKSSQPAAPQQQATVADSTRIRY
ncbi:MAG: hypothetical protein WCS65_02810 [Verrucomicrobiae bacterium]